MPRKPERGVRRGDGFITPRPQRDGTVRYQVRWREPGPDGFPVWRAKTLDSEDDAEDELRRIARAKRDGRYIPPSELTVAELVAQHLARNRSDWTPSTSAAYADRARLYIVPALGSVRVVTLTAPRLQHWLDELSRRRLNGSTIDGAAHVLTGALDGAVRLGILEHNPADGIKRPKARPKPVGWWSAPDARTALASLTEPKWRALYTVALMCGLRPGELRALQWRDVELERARLIVRRTATRDADSHAVIGAQTKTKRDRAVQLAPAAIDALRVWRRAQAEIRLACPEWHDDGLVFDRGDGRLLPYTTWHDYHRALCARAGVPYISPHKLRHTYATLQLEAGVHPKIVSDVLGHTKIETTLDTYSHVSTDLQRAAADAIALTLDDADTTTSAAENG